MNLLQQRPEQFLGDPQCVAFCEASFEPASHIYGPPPAKSHLDGRGARVTSCLPAEAVRLLLAGRLAAFQFLSMNPRGIF